MRRRQEDLRNLSVIAHVDHGKSTLSDCLIRESGLSKKSGFCDSGADEIERGITIKSTSVYMRLADNVAVNLIDSPGHVDFSSEVSAALRLTDGAIVVVDAISGPAVQTGAVLRQAVKEGVVPVLCLNKLDKAFLSKKLPSDAIYSLMREGVESMNALLAQFGSPHSFDPLAGNVCFGSAKQGWLVSLTRVAELYAQKTGTKQVDQVLKLLWGERFYDVKTKRWSKSLGAGERGFCRLVLEPLQGIFGATKGANVDWPLMVSSCAKLGLVPPPSAKGLPSSKAQALVLASLFPAGAELARLVRDHLPSPSEAQRTRASLLYTGPQDDRVALGIAQSDESAPLSVFVSKLVPSAGGKHLLALGRVYSGSLSVGARVHVLDADYDPEAREESPPREARVTSLSRPRGPASAVPLDVAVPGDIVLIGGVDAAILKSATLSEAAYHPIRMLKLSVTPVVHRAVSVASGGRSALQKALVVLSQTDPLVRIRRDEESGETIVGASGELHLEVLLSDLQRLCGGHRVTASEPLVGYRESVESTTPEPALAKSSNKLNRVWMTAEPFEAPASSKKVWVVDEMEDIAFVDASTSVPYLSEVKTTLVAAFNQVCASGPLCNEPVRGVTVRLSDAKLHADSPHRSSSQLAPATSRAIKGAILGASPCLLEPVFAVDIEAPSQSLAQVVYSILSSRRGTVVSNEACADGSVRLVAHLPVQESFGLDAEVRERTSGSAFFSMNFSHYERVPGNALGDATSLAGRVVADIRARKGLCPGVDAARFIDRL